MVHIALVSHSQLFCIPKIHRVVSILKYDYSFATVKKGKKTPRKTILSNDKFLSAFDIQCHSRLQINLPVE